MSTGTVTTGTRTRIPGVVVAALLDAIVVLVFVTIGRSSHAEGLTAAGIASTAWPFLAGTAAGWLAGRPWRDPLRLRPGDVAVWLGALVGGMALRVIVGQGTEPSFVVVAGVFLALFLLGWRALGALVVRLRGRATS